MIIRIGLCFAAALSFTGCAALSSQISEGMAPQISTEVAVQVGTAVVEQVATVVAERLPSTAAVADDGSNQSEEEVGQVTRVVDGDTIDVLLNGVNTRVRYLQMNTPERDEPCAKEATEANRALVEGKTVRLVPDKELVDPYDRLLRYIYVGDVLVNRVLVEGAGLKSCSIRPTTPTTTSSSNSKKRRRPPDAAAIQPAFSTMAQPPADEGG